MCEDSSGCAVVSCSDIQCGVFGFHDGAASKLGAVDGYGKAAEATLRLFQADNLLEAMKSGP